MYTRLEDRFEIVNALVAKGHSDMKALEIALDAERADAHAIAWLKSSGVAAQFVKP